ncbi:glycosyltransferase family 4 protein [bacterium]|nr:glycosyltransferase family 4 protein [bacterium]
MANFSAHSRGTLLLFFNDWPVRPAGANCGGGETATISLAEAFARLGFRVVACASLPDGEVTHNGVEYWNFGRGYELHSLRSRIAQLGPFSAFAATLAHPFLLLAEEPNCRRKILVNHSPGVNPSGLESRTVMHLVDHFVCVSEAQKKVILSRGEVPEERISIVRNGFDPELFRFQGPEKRDWNRLLYAGRLEPSKGIHFLLGAFVNLKNSFPDLELHVFGDASCWPSLHKEIFHLQAKNPSMKFYGKVPQSVIAEELQRAGCLVFPSLSFESAGLSVLDAQASGCPVVASNVGGVSEYLLPECGVLVESPSPQTLEESLRALLSDRERMKEMSRNGERLARFQTWDSVAQKLVKLIDEEAAPLQISVAEPEGTREEQEKDPLAVLDQHEALYRTWFRSGLKYEELLDDHDLIASGTVLRDELLFGLIAEEDDHAIIPFWQALRYDTLGEKVRARGLLQHSLALGEGRDWQPLFRLILLEAELGELPSAGGHARHMLREFPDFPLQADIERLIEQIEAAGIPAEELEDLSLRERREV